MKSLVCAVTLALASSATSLVDSQGGRRVTFTRHVAPIVFDRCGGCHRPGGAAPFSLLTYDAVRRHATQIAAVTKRRFMPPWKAEPGIADFVGQKPLSDDEIAVIAQWVADGVEEGNPAELPPPPAWTDGWQLGRPDLIVELGDAYTLQADGADVFRIFVLPLPVAAAQYVRGFEFRPGNPRVVHHANIRLDRTPQSRQLDARDPTPGYDGLMARSAQYPDGHFLGWTPGQLAPLLPKHLAWRLDRGTDLVLQLHMQPSGKPELVAPSVGIYFGGEPPIRTPAMLRLGRQNLDIPAGDRRYTITDAFVLPVDVELIAVQPHAHYRARDVRGDATLPTGETRPLLVIGDWDFRWQHVYRYVDPVKLPRGTRVSMRYTYDNSADNPRNPQRPPQRALWGQRSSDEMGDFWLQLLTRDDRDLATLDRTIRPKMAAEDAAGLETLLRRDPDDAELHDDLALLHLELGRADQAVAQFAASARLRPEAPASHFNLGTALTAAGRLEEAIAAYRRALTLKPDYANAHNNLGGVLAARGQINEAMTEYRGALAADPDHAEAHNNLGRLLVTRRDAPAAVPHLRAAVRAKPDYADALTNLAWVLATAPDAALRDPEAAVRIAERAAALTDRSDARVLDVLAAAYAAAGSFARAIETADAALRLASTELAGEIRSRQQLYRRREPYVAR